MLKILDVVIGLVTVMLLFGMVVTLITQFVISAIQSRGRNLKNGLAGLLNQLDPTMSSKLADEIAEALLRHPLTAGRRGALGAVIHREEFTVLLMEMAAGQSVNQLSNNAKAALSQLLKNNGVSDPANTLKNVRDFVLQLESANPELANNVRSSMAILQEAKSEFVAKIHGWFDQTIDRVSQRFTVTAHAITFVAAVIVAFVLQLDTIYLVSRLSADDALRQAMVTAAPGLLQKDIDQKNAKKDTNTSPASGAASPTSGTQNSAGAPRAEQPLTSGQTDSTGTNSAGEVGKTKSVSKTGNNENQKTAKAPSGRSSTTTTNNSGSNSSPAKTQDSGATASEKTIDFQKEIYETLNKNGLITMPQQFKWPFVVRSMRATDETGKKTWQWPITWSGPTGGQLLGILLSALLLSLGAPFWYSTLQNLLRLRSVVAQKDDQQRAARQKPKEDGASSDGASVAAKDGNTAQAAMLQGEQGNLQAVG